MVARLTLAVEADEKKTQLQDELPDGVVKAQILNEFNSFIMSHSFPKGVAIFGESAGLGGD